MNLMTARHPRHPRPPAAPAARRPSRRLALPLAAAMAAALALAAPAAASQAPAAASQAPAATRANLGLAYAADVNAQARYAAFAEVAAREGYLQVARLFRAAARSEQVRAGVHARALRLLGGEPLAAVEPFQVKGTRQNLLATLAHEGTERIRDYPRFAQQARRDGATEAVLGFTLAQGAEVGLARLYQDAMGRLEEMRRPGEELHVCPTCGHVVRGPPPAVCPVSLSPGEAFERVG